MEVSINQLMEWTGKSFRTIKKRLAGLKPVREDGRATYYNSVDALPCLYEAQDKQATSPEKQLFNETLLLERARREKLEIEVKQLRGEVVPIEEVGKVVAKEYTYVRSQLLSIPTKLAKPLSLTDDPNEVKEKLEDALSECLSELTADTNYERARLEFESAREAADGDSSGAADAADSDESGRVGGQVSVSKPGGVEHARPMENRKRRSRTRPDARVHGPEGEEDHRHGADPAPEDGAD